MLYFALILIGFSALTAQIICIREYLILATGNELIIGIFFSNWLLSSALGSYIFSRIRLSNSTFPSLQLAFALLFPVILYLIRISPRIVGMAPGEGYDLSFLFISSFILLGSLGFLSGAQFTAACTYASYNQKGDGSTVYLFEAIGSIISGLASSFLILTLINHFTSAWIISILNLLSATFLFYMPLSPRRQLIIFTCWIALFVAILPVTTYLHHFSVSQQWPDYKVVAYENSRYGNVMLLQREGQSHLLSNGIPIAVAPIPDIDANESFVHIPLLMHQKPRNVLLIGNGFGGVPEEILKHPIQRLDYAELDPLIIDVADRYLKKHQQIEDTRLNIHPLDGGLFLKETRNIYDLILLNLPAPSSLEINRFYSMEFFEQCHRKLSAQGILAFTLPASGSYLSTELIEMHKSILQAAQRSFSSSISVPNSSTLLIFFADQELPEITTLKMIDRLNQRNISSQLISAPYLQYKLHPDRQAWYHEQLKIANHRDPNSIYHPHAVFYAIQYDNAQYAPFLNSVLQKIAELPSWSIPLFLLLLMMGIYFISRKDRRKTVLLMSITGAGFAGMSISVICVLLFQSVFGYVYQWIGVLLTVFMVGIAFGSYYLRRYKNRYPIRTVYLYLEMSWIATLIFMTILFFVHQLNYLPDLYFKLGLLLIIFSGGTLVGSQFPAALFILNKSKSIAGKVYAFDLLGGWAGGFLISIVVLPVFGIWLTCSLLIVIKIFNTIVFYRLSG
jgi:spermidine synthase